MKVKALISIICLITGMFGGYILHDQLTEPCETQVIRKLKNTGDGNSITVQQIDELKAALQECEKAQKQEARKDRREKRKSKKNEKD